MRVRSLGIRTDLMFHRLEGEVVDRGSYLAIRTPSNPTYRWGNYLLFDRPPGKGDLDRWTDVFHRAIGSPPGIRHRVFAWDDPGGALGHVEPFLDAGFRLEQVAALTAREVQAHPAASADVEVRVLRHEREWRAAVDLQVRCRDAKEPEEEYRAFRTRKMSSYRRLQEQGIGAWYGAFVGDRLVADMGLFVQDGLARYQHVETDPDFRRRGIARRMLAEVARRGRAMHRIDWYVILADPDDHAIGLYRSVGFARQELVAGLEHRG